MKKVLIETARSKLFIIPDFTTADDVDMDYINSIPLISEPPIVFMGRECRQRRDIGFYSDISGGYKYSNQTMDAKPMLPELQLLMNVVNAQLDTKFNGVLVNRYKTGADYLSAHSDDEKGLDKANKMVAGLCYGAVRKFRIRTKNDKKKVMDIAQLPGMLLCMEGDFQEEFTHEIPKELTILEPRTSLTFRSHTV